MKKKVLILGCTGSIGTSTISIIREFSHLFEVCGITAHTNKDALDTLSKEFNCKSLLTSGTENLEDFIQSSNADICVNGISGSAGLMPSIYSLKSGINLALANKETIVMASDIVKKLAKENNCTILPVDSEHSAVFSLIERYGRENIDKIILTASGGPFRNYSLQDLTAITPKQALKHPTWSMGAKITIDSATLANKGLEVIEACRLFDISSDNVVVSVHPQSLVHSLVVTKDGDTYAQISKPDMRRPIVSALTYPQMLENSIEKLDFLNAIEMTFTPPNTDVFRMLPLAYEAQTKSGAYTIAYNAANEVAVDLFLKEKISFLGITELVSEVLKEDWSCDIKEIDDVFLCDKSARKKALDLYENPCFNEYRTTFGDN